MKRKIALIPVLALILALSGCTGSNPGKEITTFEATVIEVHEDSMTVKPAEGSEELKSADAIIIGLDDITDGSTPEVGDTYEIEYNGEIMESYPAQIADAKVKLVTKEK